MYDQWLLDILISFLTISLAILTSLLLLCLIGSIRNCRECLFKAFIFFLTIFSSLLLMAFVMGVVGCVMMMFYAVGSLIFKGYIDGLMALYVAIDTAFILGGGLAVIIVLFCYSDIYDYFSHCIGESESVGLSIIDAIRIDDDTERSTINFEKTNLLSRAREKAEEEDFFRCDACQLSLLTPITDSSDDSCTCLNPCSFFNSNCKKNRVPTPITITHQRHGGQLFENTYHLECLKCTFSWQGPNSKDPATNLRLDAGDYTFKRYENYKGALHEAWENFLQNEDMSNQALKKRRS